MASKSVYVCQQCGYNSARWLGRCPECEQWNSFVEEAPKTTVAAPLGSRSSSVPIDEIPLESGARMGTGIGELDRVLGGGLVPGAVVLMGGEPGIGKTTLLLQAMASLAGQGKQVLYVSGEESDVQIRLRAERLGAVHPGLLVLCETRLEAVVEEINRLRPAALVVDSVQAIASALLQSPPGTLSQIREVAQRITGLVKEMGCPTFLVGHVTKEGNIAGPKVLEHMVDTVLYFEGDGEHSYRMVRATKNRFGSTNEVGIFGMEEEGLRGIENPSALFLGDRPGTRAGTMVVPSLEGRRPILVEVQALVGATGYPSPRRSASGIDLNRLVMLVAVLEKHCGLVFGGSDIYVNAAGGMRLVEPAADLGILLALASSHRNLPPPEAAAAFGEVSLTGEVRGVPAASTRLREVGRLGFRRCILPAAARDQARETASGMELMPCGSVSEALAFLGL